MPVDKNCWRMFMFQVCPGYVATDINNHAGQKSVAEGADSIVYLALLPPSVNGEQIKPRGEFVYERRVYDWVNVEVSDCNKFNLIFDSAYLADNLRLIFANILKEYLLQRFWFHFLSLLTGSVECVRIHLYIHCICFCSSRTS